PISSQTVSQMVDILLSMEAGTRLYLLAPVVRGRKGEYKKDLAAYLQRGFSRVRIDGEFYELDAVPDLDKKRKHDIEIVVDRVIIKPDADNLATRLADSLETALGLSDGLAYADDASSGQRTVFSARFACPVSGFTIDEIEPRLFSFNNPFGACPDCDGLGVSSHFEAQLVVPDPRLSLRQGALAPWAKSTSKYYIQTLESLAKTFGFSLDVPFEELDIQVQHVLLHGSGNQAVEMIYDDGLRSYRTTKPFEGLLPNLTRRYVETDSNWVRDELEKFRAIQPCEGCGGKRLKSESLAVRIDDKDISDISALSIGDAADWFTQLSDSLSAQQSEIAVRILKEISERLGFLSNVGLRYLNLSRNSGTLSGGESQRIRLASQIGSGLTGVLYVLDEPSIGLHQRDNDRLLATLTRLRDLGNTVLVVEHDEDAIRAADYVIDMGPGAGVHGGQVVAVGTAEQIMNNQESLTGQYLSGVKEIKIPTQRRKTNKKRQISLIGASGNNLQNVSVNFPLGVLTCVTGVSGGGKSTLVLETLWKALSRQLHKAREIPAPYDKLTGMDLLDKVVDIDQSPIGRTPRSNPATYTGAFTPIREWFAGLPESKSRGYTPGRFSFNVKGGRCEACQGDGVIKIEMHFLPDVYVTCDTCKGKRYNRETLEITWRDKSIADILDMTVEEGVEYFKAVPFIRDKLQTMLRVGLGYVRIGQQATTLSGGEAQRVKLSKELSRRATGKTIYILDEPTTGLHFADIAKLLEVLQELVDGGNTVIVIEHNLDVIKTADYIIDMGPEGGDGGGQVVATGTPEDVAAEPQSHTGRYLAPLLLDQSAQKKVS
ncbi:MAG: excinuclease ABC subunit UvrA, partial [Candidatus Puniceispirillaceae bacterium]